MIVVGWTFVWRDFCVLADWAFEQNHGFNENPQKNDAELVFYEQQLE